MFDGMWLVGDSKVISYKFRINNINPIGSLVILKSLDKKINSSEYFYFTEQSWHVAVYDNK